MQCTPRRIFSVLCSLLVYNAAVAMYILITDRIGYTRRSRFVDVWLEYHRQQHSGLLLSLVLPELDLGNEGMYDGHILRDLT